MSHILKNSIFLHIPKTGGCTTINICKEIGIIEENIQQTQGGSHPNIEELKESGHWDRKPFHFTVIRHPIEWLMSFYAWRGGKKKNLKPYINEEYENFEHLVEMCIEDKLVSECFDKYLVEIEMTVKLENLRKDLIAIFTLFEEKFDPYIVLHFPRPGGGVNPKPKINRTLAKKFLESEKELVKRFDYNYINESWIKNNE